MGTSPIGLELSRRGWIALALLTALAFPSFSRGATAEERKIEFYNIHTKDNISIVYKRDGKFIPEALQKLNYFMRDWRKNETIKIDPDLFDLIWEIHQELGSKQPVNLICGHRSGATNEMLRRTRGGQARASLHITGQAADIQFPDIPIKQLRNSALIRERGGVGYYPTSAIPFVHVDTGRVRHWPRLPRQELAILFPSGHSGYIPADGRPLTKQDFQMALANLEKKGGELPTALQRRLENGGQGRTILARLAPDMLPAVVRPGAEPKPHMLLASLTPFAGFGDGRPEKKPDGPGPLIRSGTQQTAAAPDADVFKRDFLAKAPTENVPDDEIAGSPDYDDDHPDELDYQPFPILPLMVDTPVASMDLSGDAPALSLSKVHMMFAETREMYQIEFQPGLQFAQLFWAQRFHGTAVNTALKRLARDNEPRAVQTAEATRTARK